jgi:aspartyl-tRNA(Asn)/glutamyl-tRNA(Gln) amidotransferase subunit A
MRLNELTIKQSSEMLKKKEISAVELTQAVLDVIKEKDKDINAYLEITEDLALEQARQADEVIDKGEKITLLTGVPVAIKDAILVEGIKCTAGSKILENYIAPYDATAVRKIKETGAVIVGKTNMDEFAMGASTENSAYGPTRNPHDLECVPGGSSGGSAAAVAAHETIGALGSDTGGSIRQPAGFCGVVGLKPTYGRVSRYGLIAMASSLDQIGPLAKTVEDAEIIFNAISGIDRFDSTSVSFDQRPDYYGRLELALSLNNVKEIDEGKSGFFPLKGLKIGVPDEYFTEGLDKIVEGSVRQAIIKLEELGAEIMSVSLPHSKYALACYYVIAPSEVSSNMARYDGIKYGKSEVRIQKQENINLLDVYLKTRGEYLGREVRRRIMLGTYVLSAGYYDAYYLRAQKVRALVKRDFENAFRQVDILVAPTSPTTAFKIGEKADDPVKMYLADIYTVPINLAGLPALSLPCGFVGGLPVGLQIIGRHWDEKTILSVGKIYEKASGKHIKVTKKD